MPRFVNFALAALTVAAPAAAQDIAPQIDRIFSWATPDAPGCVVGVSRHGTVLVNRAYGLADLERKVPLSPETVFDIGSTQKQFNAAAILLLVEDGRLSLSDDIRKYFPELPDYGHTITVDHLLTHTSGIRDWVPLLNLSGADEDALTVIFRQRDLNFVPGTEFSYSNSGYALLKELVARVSGVSFADFARTRMFEPLGMNATQYAADVTAAENHALAYEKEDDAWKPAMMLGNDRGGGAVLTTTGDLLIWNDALKNARLGSFVSEKLHEPARLANGRQLSYARGLFLEPSDEGLAIWHTGSAAGYKSWLSRHPEQDVSIAILCNSGDSADRGDYAEEIYHLFLPTPAPAPGPAPASASAPAAPDHAGLFVGENNDVLRLIVNNGRLILAGAGPLVALGENRFGNREGSLQFRSDDRFELRFVSADVLEMTSMEGDVTRYRRAHPYAPSPEDLNALAGSYRSDELNAVFELAAGEKGVTVRLNGSPPFEFAPVDTDTFMRSMMLLRIRRNDSGQVVGLDYSNPLIRRVTFTRRETGK